ncbi:hypothetical protein ACP70R_046092 [Stipagrostis hirtigluma subsp. patula]
MNRVMARASPAGVDDAGTLNRWRELFRGHDIFDVIDHAILVAAADSPQELRRRRDCIVEQIFLHTAQASPAPGRAAAGDSHGGVRHVSAKAISKEASCSKGSMKYTGAPAQVPKDEDAEDQRLQAPRAIPKFSRPLFQTRNGVLYFRIQITNVFLVYYMTT